MAANALAPVAAAPVEKGTNDSNTTTPIRHVIIIIGENRTFDHLFATYQPVNASETVLNLLSEGIVKADGTPGTNYSKVPQNHAEHGSLSDQPVRDEAIRDPAGAIGRRRIC
jgi:phospholipase C